MMTLLAHKHNAIRRAVRGAAALYRLQAPSALYQAVMLRWVPSLDGNRLPSGIDDTVQPAINYAYDGIIARGFGSVDASVNGERRRCWSLGGRSSPPTV